MAKRSLRLKAEAQLTLPALASSILTPMTIEAIAQDMNNAYYPDEEQVAMAALLYAQLDEAYSDNTGEHLAPFNPEE